ncbi:MAG: lysophospholipase [Tepidanaerobacteraceae bacterium]|nr:lysophospholipase [Tepidanaerobacteraceae bacterium]HQE06019.1 lysophospholipase [Tepidanaerobacteraceae bacterium]
MAAKRMEGKLKSFDGTELFYRKDVPEKPKAIVVIVHGLCEHSGRYDYVTEKFNEKGLGVYRFDNRGHGKSGGDRGYVEDFQHFFDDADKIVELALKEQKDLPVFMLGHSMGGFIAAGYGMKYPGKLRGQIFSGPALLEIEALVKDIKKDDYFEKNPREKAPNALSSLICRDTEVVKAYEEDPLVLKETNLKLLGEAFVKGPKWLAENVSKYEYPCLILHGEDDRIVPADSSKWLYENAPSKDKSIKIYEDCYHEILNEKEEKDEVINDIITWIEARI